MVDSQEGHDTPTWRIHWTARACAGYNSEASGAPPVMRIISVNPMKSPLISAAKLGLLVMLTPFGCSKPPPLSPVQLMQQIATADRVVLTNWPSTSVEFSGTEAQKLIRGVSETKGHKIPKNAALACPAGCYLQFYRGTNLLAQVDGHDKHFIMDHVCYTDWSGVLQAAWKTVYEKGDKR